jgi:hypothetical protein
MGTGEHPPLLLFGNVPQALLPDDVDVFNLQIEVEIDDLVVAALVRLFPF